MILSLIASFLLGLSKAGVKGPGVVIVGLVAMDFGAKSSTGILLPLLMFADVFAVLYYNRFADWQLLKKFLPLMLVGVVVAAFFGQQLDDQAFKYWMACIIVLGLVLLILRDMYWDNHIPQNRLFSDVTGFLSGFTSMIGNLAGPFANIFFLSQKIEKNVFIGTAAWVFLIINWFKFPFHVLMWKTIERQTLLIDLKLLIPMMIGFFVGVVVVKSLSEYIYKLIIYGSTLIGVVMIFMS